MTLASPPINSTDWASLFVAVNTATSGWFGALVPMVVSGIVFMSLKWGTSPAKAGSTAGLVGFVFSTVFLTLGIATWYVVIAFFALTVATSVGVYFEGRNA